MNYKIILTGGGTAGHVTPNLALIDELQPKGWIIDYIGSAFGIEKDIISARKIPFHAVSSGKLRRYLSFKNLLDPFKILLGIWQSYFLIRKLKPNVIFSKGGFVAFPVVVGGWLNRIPIIAHESDLTPGLANRLSFPFVNKICLTFDGAKKHFKNQDKVIVTGTPIRSQLLQGDKAKGLKHCGFNELKPCLLIIGGSQGANLLNKSVREALDKLSLKFQIIHLCGKGKIDNNYLDKVGYCQFEYVSEELADLFAAADIVISRSGANSVYEILALAKPHVFIPLSQKVSRGDQIHNARYFERQGISEVIADDKLTANTLMAAVDKIDNNREEIIKKIKALGIESASLKIVNILQSCF